MSNESLETISDQIGSILSSIMTDTDDAEKHIHKIDDTTIQIKEQVYRVVTNYREGFDFFAFEQRYQEYFEKFEFIVGDWGFEQLRLRGFYQLNKRKVPREQIIDQLDDYLKEYCNFGCKYFVLAKEEALLKYNQLILATQPLKKVKPLDKPMIQTKTKALKEKNTTNETRSHAPFTKNNRKKTSAPTATKDKPQVHLEKPVPKKEHHNAFQIKQLKQKENTRTSKQTKAKKAPQPIVQSTKKRNFIIKQQS